MARKTTKPEVTTSAASTDPQSEEAQELKKSKKAAQARINGSKSHGPITPAGKAKSSRNAIRHGLTANQHTLLEAEFPDEYNEVRSAFIDDLRPATKAELRLVEKIANLDWRLERLVMMETSLLDMEVGANFDNIAARFSRIDGIGFIVEAWKQSSSTSHCLDLLRRYMATLQHQFNSTLANFRNFEKIRLARTQGGRHLDEPHTPPYEAPKFEKLIPAHIDDAPPPPSQEFWRNAVPAATAPLRNEPIRNHKISELRPPAKRPAA
ncbi:MAG TPA: hypothetical protein VGL53_13315 [Bryobacteraceae bacterium]|jgi:hypothetical protein